MSTINLTDDQKKYSGDNLKSLRKAKGLSLEGLGGAIGVSKGTIWRYEKGQTYPEGFYLEALKRFFKNDIVPRETGSVAAEPGPEQQGVMRAGDRVGSPFSRMELERVDLLLTELGSWARRTVLVSPQAIDDLEPAVRRLINEVEGGRLTALKMDVVAHPDMWEENLRALVMALPTLPRRRLLEWLAEQTSGQADREQRPVRETAAGGEAK